MPLSALLDGFGPVTARRDGDTVVASMHGVPVTATEDGPSIRLSHRAELDWSGTVDVERLRRVVAARTLARPALTAASLDDDGGALVIEQWVPADADAHALALAVRDLVATVGVVVDAAADVGIAVVPVVPVVPLADDGETGAASSDDVEEPAVEEPAVEEPAVEEAAVEEPPVEEPAVEEPSVDEQTVGEAADDDHDVVPGEHGEPQEEPADDEPDASPVSAGWSDEADDDEIGEWPDGDPAVGVGAPAAAGVAEAGVAPVEVERPEASIAEEPADEPVDAVVADDEATAEHEVVRDAEVAETAEVEEELAETVWAYVHEEVEVRGLTQTDEVVGHLRPGRWYAIMQTGNGWAHVVSADGSLEGWVDDRRVIRNT